MFCKIGSLPNRLAWIFMVDDFRAHNTAPSARHDKNLQTLYSVELLNNDQVFVLAMQPAPDKSHNVGVLQGFQDTHLSCARKKHLTQI